MAYYTTGFLTYLSTADGVNFTIDSVVIGEFSQPIGSDDTYTPGEILHDVDDGNVHIVQTYVGSYGDGAIFRIEIWHMGEKFPDSYEMMNQTDYSDVGGFTMTPSAFVACFLEGVRIGTPGGARKVEDLSRGDLVLTQDGRAIPIKWIGRQSVAWSFNRDENRAPIRIAAGALGLNLPARDLKLTADHALLLDEVLVQAGVLVNGTTIRRMTRAETGDHYTVWHIETEGHEVIMAEDCAAETFIDNVTRRRFDNYAEYAALYGDEVETMTESSLPRAMSVRQLPPGLRARVMPPLAA